MAQLVMSARARRFMDLPRTARAFRSRLEEHETAAAERATQESRLIYTRWLSGRPLAPPRRGRPTTNGQFANYILWQRDAMGAIDFDLPGLEAKAPYWLIQEIGTNESARILNPPGAAAVRSQKGRKLPYGFYWADGPGGTPTRPTGPSRRNIPSPFASPNRRMSPGQAIGQQQLYADVGTAWRGARTMGIGRIRREIRGKHFIRDGGFVGMDTLRDLVMADANKTFRG